MDIGALEKRYRRLLDEMEQLCALPKLSVKEDRRLHAIDGQLRQLETQMTAYLERKNELAMSASNPRAVEPGTDPGFNYNTRDASRAFVDIDPMASLDELRGQVLAGLEHDRYTPASVAEAASSTLARVSGNKRQVALRMLCTGDPLYRSAFAKLMRDERHLINDAERQSITRAQSLTDASGGFAVPFTLDTSIIGVTASTANPIRSMARVAQTTTDTWNGVTGTAVSFSWDAEAAEVSDDSITLTQPSITVHKLAGFVPFSVEVGADWSDIESDLRMMLAEGRDNAEGAAFWGGSGTGEPFGIRTALAGTGSEINEASAGTFTSPDVYAVLNALDERYLNNAEWAMHIGTANDIRQFDTQGGSSFWVGLGGGTPERLLGLPSNIVNNADDSPSLAAGNNYIIVLGDWSRYVIVDRVGMNVELVPHLFGASNRPTGQRGLYAYARTGADSVDDGAFVLLNITV